GPRSAHPPRVPSRHVWQSTGRRVQEGRETARGARPVLALGVAPAEARKDLRGHALQDRLLVGARLIDDELVDAGRAVAPDHVLEGAAALPWIGQALLRHLARPSIE